MWSYYGSKSKIIGCYPAPKHDTIIEPFAGTAQYSLKWFEKDILLIDKYEFIIKIWKWLQVCSEGDIKGLPNPKPREDIRNYTFDCEEAQMLMRFMIGGGLASPQWIVSPQGFGGGVESSKKRIIANLFKIRHWKITHGIYNEIENIEATWFIDPPCQFGGHKYVCSNKKLNYEELATWIQNRAGQTIVCENTKADWMNFKPIKQITGSTFKTTEAIWCNHETAYDKEQLQLF